MNIRDFFKGNMPDDDWDDLIGWTAAGVICIVLMVVASEYFGIPVWG